MYSIFNKRMVVFAAAVIALGALILLAGGISSVQFKRGIALPDLIVSSPGAPPTGSGYSDPRLLVFLIAFLLLVVIPITIFLFLRYPQLRKRILYQIIYTGMWAAGLYIILQRLQVLIESMAIEPVDVGGGSAYPFPAAPLIEPYTTAADPRLANVLSFILAVGLALAGWMLLRRLRLAASRKRGEGDQIAATAQAALEEIRMGGDLRNIILNCYRQMNEIVAERSNIRRDAHITPSEFARRLEAAGMPSRDVQRLTRLFEAVRYGAKSFGSREEAEAELCLSSVVDSLGDRS